MREAQEATTVSIAFGSALIGVPPAMPSAEQHRVSIAFGSALIGVAHVWTVAIARESQSPLVRL